MFVCSCFLFNIHQHTVTVMKKYVFHVSQDLLQIRSYVYAEEPNIDIHNFIGTFTRVSVTVMCTWPRSCPTKPWKAHIESRRVSLTHPHILLRIAIICWSGQNLLDVLLCSGVTSGPVPARLCSSPDIWAFILISGMMRLELALANC